MNPGDADHRDLKLAPDGTRMTIRRNCVCGLHNYLVVQKMAPLYELPPFGGATMW